MKSVIFIRIAAVLTFIHAVLHTVGGVFGKADPGPAAVAVAAMKANQFLLMGNLRTYWDFYFGMGLGVTISLTTESIVLWFLASLVHTHSEKLRPILLTFAFGYLTFAVNSYFNFFLAPVIVETLIALCLIAAAVTMQKSTMASPVPLTRAS